MLKYTGTNARTSDKGAINRSDKIAATLKDIVSLSIIIIIIITQ
jgi:hypothetical protein